MSEKNSPLRKQEKEKAKRSNARLWFGLSLGITALITAWAFSMPFRSGGLSFNDREDIVASSDRGGDADSPLPYDDAESFRSAARAMDAEYMQSRYEKTRRPDVPGKFEVRRQWERHVEHVRNQIRTLGTPREGSLEWQERQELIESLEDAPL